MHWHWLGTCPLFVFKFRQESNGHQAVACQCALWHRLCDKSRCLFNILCDWLEEWNWNIGVILTWILNLIQTCFLARKRRNCLKRTPALQQTSCCTDLRGSGDFLMTPRHPLWWMAKTRRRGRARGRYLAHGMQMFTDVRQSMKISAEVRRVLEALKSRSI